MKQSLYILLVTGSWLILRDGGAGETHFRHPLESCLCLLRGIFLRIVVLVILNCQLATAWSPLRGEASVEELSRLSWPMGCLRGSVLIINHCRRTQPTVGITIPLVR